MMYQNGVAFERKCLGRLQAICRVVMQYCCEGVLPSLLLSGEDSPGVFVWIISLCQQESKMPVYDQVP